MLAQKIRKHMARRNVTMTAVINEALREGLKVLESERRKEPYVFKVVPHSFGFRPGIDLNKLNQFADDMGDEEAISKTSR
jgi:hypothetical protein